MQKSEMVTPLLITDPVEAAIAADLRYVNDLTCGIHRKQVGKSFRYVDDEGHAMRESATLSRIKSLAIPPAWTDVWICPTPDGHIQAVGRDAKGRKQYRYHPLWRAERNKNKFNRMITFGEALPTLRERIAHDLALPGLPRQKVLALVVQLLESTCIRVGNEEYARANKSFGLTTLRDRHVEVSGEKIQFAFKGKSGKFQSISLHDKRLAQIVKHYKDIPGQDLFQYVDDEGNHHAITSTDVNAYLHEITDQDFTAKDFRTWGGSSRAVVAFQELGQAETQSQAKKNVTCMVKTVAAELGNTPTICSKYYLHPAITQAYLDGSLFAALEAARHSETPGLHFEEQVLLAILKQQSAL